MKYLKMLPVFAFLQSGVSWGVTCHNQGGQTLQVQTSLQGRMVNLMDGGLLYKGHLDGWWPSFERATHHLVSLTEMDVSPDRMANYKSVAVKMKSPGIINEVLQLGYSNGELIQEDLFSCP